MRLLRFIAKQPASAPHMLRIVPHPVPRVGRSDEHFPDGFELHLLPSEPKTKVMTAWGEYLMLPIASACNVRA